MSTIVKAERNEVNNTQNGASASRGYVIPSVNITETKDGYVLEAEMPGVSKDALDITLEGTQLTLVGRRSQTVPDAQLVYRELSLRDFRRAFELDPSIDVSRIDARIENGVLTLFLPKAEQVKPRRITVN